MDFFRKSTIQVTCEKGLVPWLEEELGRSNEEIVRIHKTGIELSGNIFDCIRLNLNSRIAYSVLYLLKEFRAVNADELYAQASKIPWHGIIPADSYFSITANVHTDTVRDTRYPALKLKDAVVDRIKAETGVRPDSGKDRHRIVLTLNWFRNKVWIYLNTSGRKLSDRGYRKNPHTAPLRETLASAILMASDYTGKEVFLNPMCGSGTLAIEAALLAKGCYPQIHRDNFCFKHLQGYKEEYYTRYREETGKSKAVAGFPRIIATDHDLNALRAAQLNARTAGVEDMIEFKECDFADSPVPENRKGVIIMNPEYGRRLGEVESLKSEYKRIGDWLKQDCSGYRGYVFTGNRDLAKLVGLHAARRYEFFNGNIECRLLKYELYSGSRNDR